MVGKAMICCLLFSLNAAAQEQGSVDSVSAQKSDKSLMTKIHQVGRFLDARARAKVDSHFIEVPVKPWRVILRYKVNDVDVDYENRLEDLNTGERSDWKMCFDPPMGTSIGFWVGYRGTGISYSFSLNKNAGRYFSISSTGAKYGFNFRLRRFSTDETTISAKDYVGDELIDEMDGDFNTYAPVWIRSTYINGYYVFNGRRYSQAAAYNQSVIQRRSAGSFLAGVTWYQSSLDFSERMNAGIMLLSKNVGRIKLHQANIGIGYGYNFVPCRGLVINAMAMPTVSVYNRVKVYKYDFNYDLSTFDGEVDDYGEWDPNTRTWANGEKHKSFDLADDEGEWLKGIDMWEVEGETTYSMFRFNVDLRLGIAYNWKNYFIGIQAQYNNFFYKKDQCKVKLFDAYARVALGVRL
jgi:hypothetical protein